MEGEYNRVIRSKSLRVIFKKNCVIFSYSIYKFYLYIYYMMIFRPENENDP